MRRFTKTLAAIGTTGLFAVAPLAVATPASAALIEVEIERVLNNNNVAVVVPIQVAANVCDTNVAALIAAIEDDGETTCTARNGQDVTVRQV